jgi:hypothetical protein
MVAMRLNVNVHKNREALESTQSDMAFELLASGIILPLSEQARLD